MSCTNHLLTCNGPSKCSSCFDGNDNDCDEDCGTCFSPFNDAGIAIDGVCVETEALRTFYNEDVSTVDAQVSLFTCLCSVFGSSSEYIMYSHEHVIMPKEPLHNRSCSVYQ